MSKVGFVETIVHEIVKQIARALSAFRATPSPATGVYVLLALSGRRGFRAAGRLRRRVVDALASFDSASDPGFEFGSESEAETVAAR
jgi:hypothetical protein